MNERWRIKDNLPEKIINYISSIKCNIIISFSLYIQFVEMPTDGYYTLLLQQKIIFCLNTKH